jgi:formylmethanofuran dehydrogenase subunit C
MNKNNDLESIESLLTTADFEALFHHGSLVENGRNIEKLPVVVRFFTPEDRMQWVIVSAQMQHGEVLLSGWIDMGLGFSKTGSVWLKQITDVQDDYGIKVERDSEVSLQVGTRLVEWLELEFDT